MNTQNQENLALDYIKQDNLGRILARGIAYAYRKQPEFPIDFLGRWLLNYSISLENEQQILLREQDKEKMRQDHQNQLHQQEVQLDELENQKKADLQIDLDYDEKIKDHKYHEELLLSDFPNFLEKRKNLTGSYFAYLDFPNKPIADDDDEENAHLDNTQPKLLKYIGFSDSQQKILQRKTLQLDSGVTGDLFRDKEGGQEGGGGEEEQQGQIPLDQGDYIYVPNVVRNPRMFFFQIPRLGAYLAVPMFYNSCLNEQSFDKGLEQRIEFLKQKAEQQAELEAKKAEFERQFQEKENANEDTAELEEQWNQDQLTFQQLQEPPFPSVLRQFVASFDTLNQDREINEEDREYLNDKIKLFKECWEQVEQNELNQDLIKQIEYLETINYQTQEIVDKMNLEEDEHIKDREDYLAEFKEKTEEEQFYESDCVRLEKLQQQLNDPEIKKYLFLIKDFRVIKFPGLIQTLLYFIGYTIEEINIPKTNILNWKQVKKFINEKQFLEKFLDYDHKGAKPQEIQDYAKLNRITKRFEKYPQEEIDKYNIGLGRLYKMFQLTIKLRKQNINLRRKQKQKSDQLRVERLAEAEQRALKRAQALEDKKQEIQEKADEEEIANFSEEEFLQLWDEENPEIEIPPEIEEDIDNDLESEVQQQQANE